MHSLLKLFQKRPRLAWSCVICALLGLMGILGYFRLPLGPDPPFTGLTNLSGSTDLDGDPAIPVTSLGETSAENDRDAIRERLQAILETEEDPLEREIRLLETILALEPDQLAEAVAEYFTEDNWPGRDDAEPAQFQALEFLLQRWAALDPRGAFAFARETDVTGLESINRDLLVQKIAFFWARSEPQAALDHLREHYNNDLPPQYMPMMILEIGAHHPKVALELVREFENPDTRRNLYNPLAMSFPAETPAELAAFLNRVSKQADGDNHVLDSMAYGSLQNPVLQDPRQVLAMLNDLESNNLRSALVDNAFWQLSREAPEQVSPTLQSLDDPQMRNRAAQAAIRVALKTDPQRAATWLRHVSEEEGQKLRLIGEVTHTWVRKNPQQAQQWISTLPSGSERDTGLTKLVEDMARNRRQFPDALQWAEQISSPSQRNWNLHMIGERWMAENPQQAVTALERSSLPKNMMRDIQELYSRNPDYYP